jgi:hypothetical protein
MFNPLRGCGFRVISIPQFRKLHWGLFIFSHSVAINSFSADPNYYYFLPDTHIVIHIVKNSSDNNINKKGIDNSALTLLSGYLSGSEPTFILCSFAAAS